MEMTLNFPSSSRSSSGRRLNTPRAKASYTPAPLISASSVSSPVRSVKSALPSEPNGLRYIAYDSDYRSPSIDYSLQADNYRSIPIHSTGASPDAGSSSQTVTFSTCPKCNTTEHHFFQSSRTCARCGHKRHFARESSSKMSSSTAARTYWRPTRFTSNIVYAHVREGLEAFDEPIHQTLAAWATYQRTYILTVAAQVAQYATDSTIQTCFLELSNAVGVTPGFSGAPLLSVANQGISTIATLQADDILGTFSVLRDEHQAARSRGGRGIVIVTLVYQGASLALACRLDDGTI
ncbi:hypothetical protein FRB99_001332 [Tulasnella sp. 403]|nr:hypothetical protein FRB99_001332 [Tulasnella sp. 403]